MADSIPELVMVNVMASLALITTANSYEIEPQVRRYITDKSPPARNINPSSGALAAIELVVIETGVEQIDPLVYGKQYHDVHFLVAGLIQQSEASTTSTDTIINQIYASVLRALMADAQRGTFAATGNPLAFNTYVGEAMPLSKDMAGVEGCHIPCRVRIRTAQFDLYNQ